MSRKHFVLIAATVRTLQGEVSPETLKTVAESLAGVLATTNERFDRSRFLTACLSSLADYRGAR